MRPLSIFSRWFMQRSIVVFPEPLGPIITTTCLRLTERSIPFNTVKLPKRLTTFSARTISLPFVAGSSTRSILITPSFPNARSPAYRQHAVGIQSILNPTLDIAPHSRQQQVIKGGNNQQLKDYERL